MSAAMTAAGRWRPMSYAATSNSSAPRTLVALLVVMTGGVCPARADVRAPGVVIRIYDGASVDAATRSAAIRTAEDIVAGSGVSAGWQDCAAGGASRRCGPARGPNDVMIRILPRAGAAAQHPGSVAGPTQAWPSRVVLGFAALERASGAGVLATIYMDRVRVTARQLGLSTSVLLGRVIAHEVGHLLGSAGHTDRGVMREVWTDAQLAHDRPDDWRFTSPEPSGRAGNVHTGEAETDPAR
jgi:hypothetical protein